VSIQLFDIIPKYIVDRGISSLHAYEYDSVETILSTIKERTLNCFDLHEYLSTNVLRQRQNLIIACQYARWDMINH